MLVFLSPIHVCDVNIYLATYIEQILDQNLLLLLWQLIKDPESYVRASAIGLLGVLSSNNTIWKLYCEAISLSEVRKLIFTSCFSAEGNCRVFCKINNSSTAETPNNIYHLFTETEGNSEFCGP